MCEIREPLMSLPCALEAWLRGRGDWLYQPLLWVRSCRSTSLFNPHDLPGRQGL